MCLGGGLAGVAEVLVDAGGFLFATEGEEVLGELEAGAGLLGALGALGGVDGNGSLVIPEYLRVFGRWARAD